MPTILLAAVTAPALLLWWLNYERYHKYADRIDALANSSCMTPDGDNLTSGAMLWGLLALALTAAAGFPLLVVAVRLVRRRSGGAR